MGLFNRKAKEQKARELYFQAVISSDDQRMERSAKLGFLPAKAAMAYRIAISKNDDRHLRKKAIKWIDEVYTSNGREQFKRGSRYIYECLSDFEIAEIYEYLAVYDKALMIYQKEAEEGKKQVAKRKIAKFYTRGWAVAKNQDKAAAILREMADEKDADAVYQLCKGYLEGDYSLSETEVLHYADKLTDNRYGDIVKAKVYASRKDYIHALELLKELTKNHPGFAKGKQAFEDMKKEAKPYYQNACARMNKENAVDIANEISTYQFYDHTAISLSDEAVHKIDSIYYSEIKEATSRQDYDALFFYAKNYSGMAKNSLIQSSMQNARILKKFSNEQLKLLKFYIERFYVPNDTKALSDLKNTLKTVMVNRVDQLIKANKLKEAYDTADSLCLFDEVSKVIDLASQQGIDLF